MIDRASAAVPPPLIEDMEQRSINLTFHGIGATDRSLDAGEARVWVQSGRFAAVLDRMRGRKDVRITFDDGNASDRRARLPALQARDLRATFFVVAGRLGAPGFLDAGGVRELAAAGMTIGCHGMRHRSWRGLDERGAARGARGVRRVLEDVVRRPVVEAACPFGAYDRRVLRALRRAGYAHVYTSDGGTAGRSGWLQPRNTVKDDDDDGILSDILALESSTALVAKRRVRQAVKRWR